MPGKKRSNKGAELVRAIHAGDLALVNQLIGAGADVNYAGSLGTPLQVAARVGRKGIVAALLGAAADPNAGNMAGTPLLRAIQDCHAEIACMLVRAGADPTLARGGCTPFTDAAAAGQLEVVQAIIEARANLDTRGRVANPKDAATSNLPEARNVTPLIIAARHGHREVVKLLIEAGADLRAKDGNGTTALEWATTNSHQAVVSLLKATGRADRIDTPEELLLKAAEQGDLKSVESLLQQGANHGARDERVAKKNMTPLMLAAAAGHQEVVAVLLAAGAEIDAKDDQGLEEQRGLRYMAKSTSLRGLEEMNYRLGRTALMYAAKAGQAAAVQVLLDAKADPNMKDAAGQTALSLALDQGHRNIERILTGSHSIAPDPKAFFIAVEKGDIEAARALLNAGVDVNVRGEEGWTALLTAAFHANLEMVELLLDAGADVHAISPQTGNALATAVGAVHETAGSIGTTIKPFPEDQILPLVKRFLSACVDLDHASAGQCALSEAIINGHEKIARTLIEAGANVNHSGRDGITPLHWAVLRNNARLAKMLLEHHADVNATDQQGRTPLSIAQESKPGAIVDLLRKHGAAEESAKPAKPAEPVARSTKRDQHSPRPNFTQALQQPDYKSAIEELAKICGTKPQPLFAIKGGMTFHVHSSKTVDLKALHDKYLKKRCYVFTCKSAGTSRPVEQIAALPTTDKYEVIAAMQTNGGNYDLNTGGIIEWLKALESTQPFRLTGVGGDFLSGEFTRPIKDAADLAKRMYEFCPDIVDQGCGSVEELARLLEEKGNLFFWWD